eukprot:1127634-Amphidinium_carterae.2
MDVDALWKRKGKGKGGNYGKGKDGTCGKGEDNCKSKGKDEKGGKDKGKRKENHRKMVEKGRSFAGHVAGAEISLTSSQGDVIEPKARSLQQSERKPNAEAVAIHNQAHLPHAPWYEVCRAARAKEAPHYTWSGAPRTE